MTGPLIVHSQEELDMVDELNAFGVVKRPFKEPETLSLLPPLTFSFVADFTGRLGKLHGLVLNPMVRIEQGRTYHVSIDSMTGEALFTPIAQDVAALSP